MILAMAYPYRSICHVAAPAVYAASVDGAERNGSAHRPPLPRAQRSGPCRIPQHYNSFADRSQLAAQERQGSAIWYTAHDAASVTIISELDPSIAIPVSSAPATGTGSSISSLPAGESIETHPPAPAPAKSYLAT